MKEFTPPEVVYIHFPEGDLTKPYVDIEACEGGGMCGEVKYFAEYKHNSILSEKLAERMACFVEKTIEMDHAFEKQLKTAKLEAAIEHNASLVQFYLDDGDQVIAAQIKYQRSGLEKELAALKSPRAPDGDAGGEAK